MAFNPMYQKFPQFGGTTPQAKPTTTASGMPLKPMTFPQVNTGIVPPPSGMPVAPKQSTGYGNVGWTGNRNQDIGNSFSAIGGQYGVPNSGLDQIRSQWDQTYRPLDYQGKIDSSNAKDAYKAQKKLYNQQQQQQTFTAAPNTPFMQPDGQAVYGMGGMNNQINRAVFDPNDPASMGLLNTQNNAFTGTGAGQQGQYAVNQNGVNGFSNMNPANMIAKPVKGDWNAYKVTDAYKAEKNGLDYSQNMQNWQRDQARSLHQAGIQRNNNQRGVRQPSQGLLGNQPSTPPLAGSDMPLQLPPGISLPPNTQNGQYPVQPQGGGLGGAMMGAANNALQQQPLTMGQPVNYGLKGMLKGYYK